MFSSIVHGGKQNMTIDVAVPGMSHKFIINSDNKLVLQRLEVSFAFTTRLLGIDARFSTSEMYLHLFVIYPVNLCLSYFTNHSIYTLQYILCELDNIAAFASFRC